MQEQQMMKENIQGNRDGKSHYIRMAILATIIIFISGLIHRTQKNSPFKPILPTTAYVGQQKIYAGELHYSRIPVQYWEHRIQMVKAMGLNTLSVYIMWNFHENEDGSFDFASGSRNLTHFLELAKKHEMMVLMRPGPYVCAQWDMGGLPARLMAVEGLKLRQNNQPFLREVKEYFRVVSDVIRPYIRNSKQHDGIIILLQIENQYGFYGSDSSYIQALRDMWTDLDIVCAEYYVDWLFNLKKTHWEGANIGINDGIAEYEYDYARAFQPFGMIFGGEIYSGWLTRWGESSMQSKDVQRNLDEYGFLMRHNKSYAMYVAHGGTNFGLTAGSNDQYKEYYSFKPAVTSYDYDAPINQQGSSTEKFFRLRELIMQFADWKVPDVPEPFPMMTLPAFRPTAVGSLLQNLHNYEKVEGETLYRFESNELSMFHQGIVVYETVLAAKTSYQLNISVHDFGMLVVDGQFIYQNINRVAWEIWRNIDVVCEKDEECVLQIVVEAHGHCNFDRSMEEDYKGIYYLSTQPALDAPWTMYKVPINENLFLWAGNQRHLPEHQPAVMYYNLEIDGEIGDTYFDFSEAFYKGYVFVNGHNLGRYWADGPQYRLFCPGVWLKEGGNDIYILEMTYRGEGEISGVLTLQK